MNKTKFKDSGIEWIGEIPEHWEMSKIKYVGTARNGLTYKPADLTDETGILVLRASNIQNDKLVFDDNVYVNCEIKKDLMVKKGDILICSTNGSINLVGKNAIIKNDLCAAFGGFMMIFRTEYHKFFNYLLKSNIFDFYRPFFRTSTINQLTKDFFLNLKIPFPPLHEQQKIAEFLDKKCYVIDKTLQNLQQKIQTLKEYKKALITKCVCKGLKNSKNVDFKNIKISYLFNIVAGGDLPNLISDVKTDELNIPIYSNGTDENALYGFTNIAKIHKPCITISGRGTIGFCALRKEPFYPIVRLLCLTPKTNEANINFLYYALKNVNFDFNQTAIPQLTAPMIKQIKIPLPPLHEQQQIAQFLDNKCNKIDRLNEIYNQQIQYLSEYKKSLIYEVVSGKKSI